MRPEPAGLKLREISLCDSSRLRSLWDMLESYAVLYLAVGRLLTESEKSLFEYGLLNQADGDTLGKDRSEYRKAIEALDFAKMACNLLPLGTLTNEIERARAEYDGAVLRDRCQTEFDRLYRRFGDELRHRKFLYVPPERTGLYGQKEAFGPDVAKKFPGVIQEDIEHAANCYALGEGTACVFHLMRAMEGAVARLTKRLGVKIAPRDTWGQMISKMDERIKLIPDKSHAQKRKRAMWSEARANLYHVKEAWRNESMHPKQTYTLEQAREVLDAVRVFMTGLAKL